MCRIGINGGKRLYGCVDIEGAKNSVLPVMAASILNRTVTVIHNCPDIEDVRRMENILKYLGCTVKRENGSIYIDTENAVNRIIPGSISGTLRASSILIGPLLARFSYVKIARPGGCDIGKRPIDIHLNALKCLGAQWSLSDGYTEVEGRLRSSEVFFRLPSVGATENIIMASVFLTGQTIIHNAAKEPDIVQLCSYLCMAGADIRGAGTDTIIINGVDKLHEAEYNIAVDRIVAGTYVAAVTMCTGEVLLNNCHFKDLRGFMDIYTGMGACFKECGTGIYVSMYNRPAAINYIRTAPYPGFPTDMQSITLSVLSVAEGTSVIYEDIYEDRFKTVYELVKMGADIITDGERAVIRGISRLKGAYVNAHDLRGSAALVIAGIGADGRTVIDNAGYILRGYADLCGNLKKLGADIRWENK